MLTKDGRITSMKDGRITSMNDGRIMSMNNARITLMNVVRTTVDERCAHQLIHAYSFHRVLIQLLYSVFLMGIRLKLGITWTFDAKVAHCRISTNGS